MAISIGIEFNGRGKKVKSRHVILITFNNNYATLRMNDVMGRYGGGVIILSCV